MGMGLQQYYRLNKEVAISQIHLKPFYVRITSPSVYYEPRAIGCVYV